MLKSFFVVGRKIFSACFLFFFVLTLPVWGGDIPIKGEELSFLWALPFFGVLLSLALMPLVLPRLWHNHFGKIGALWAIVTVASITSFYGLEACLQVMGHVFFKEYFPFIIIAGTLFTVAGGIRIEIHKLGTPLNNTALMVVGTLLASWIGTTGAAMLLVRPLLSMNEHRYYRRHTMIFFIFLVCNVGGALTALGDPPLFLGFLMGVQFFWPTTHLFGPFMVMVIPLTLIYFFLDKYYFGKEELPDEAKNLEVNTPKNWFQVRGKTNLILFLCIILSVLVSGYWRPDYRFVIFANKIELQNVVRDLSLIGIGLISYKVVSQRGRKANHFSFEPLMEVVKLFASIFVTAAPVIAILQAGTKGVMEPVVSFVTGLDGQPIPDAYYWVTGALSAFLDNAPTYLVFFHMAGGNAAELMTTLAPTLIAISCGAVFMGAMTYIGNAPNFMVKAIAEQKRIQMPSFFGYMVWSWGIFFPFLALVAWFFF